MNFTLEILNKAADNIRILSAAMVEKAQSGHPGGAMGGADFINVLFSEFLVYDPNNPTWESRDRFFLDPGHMSPMLYATLALTGKFSMNDLKTFRQWGSPTPGHPERNLQRGIENTSGPLGQGHAYAIGAAIAAKFLRARFGELMNHTIFTYISDGGIQEEISQGVGRIAGHLGLENLIMFYDANNIQLSSKVDVVSSENVALKYEAWGWNVISINGNDVNEIRKALKSGISEREKPTLIIGETVMGKGAVTESKEIFNDRVAMHGQPLSKAGASFEQTVKALGGDAKNPFTIFPEVEALYVARREELEQIVSERELVKKEWTKLYPRQAKKMEDFFSNNIPKIDWTSIQQRNNQSTRAASGTVLGIFAQQVENMICASADLSNSDKTDGFLKNTTRFKKNDFSGAFLDAGVSEISMACLAIGMALHGGVIPVCATFFVFSDYMKPAVRMAALMELPVKFIWTHDSYRVGEDGPTHEPVEQEMQIRLMEHLQNHSGKNAMLVLRPADVYETTVAWEMAMNNTETPTGLLLSRQNISDLPAQTDRKTESHGARKGAYIVEDVQNSDIVLVASGSEVSTLVESASLLRNDGLKVKVVSVISEGLFFSQDEKYRNSIISPNTPVFGLTAGLPVTLERLVGKNGFVWGLNSFGYSAPYSVLDEKFGFTGEHVSNFVKDYLKNHLSEHM